jgi:hypothetical protein
MPSNSVIELWTLYSLGVSFTILRTYARIVAVGFRELRADDYLIWLAVVRIHPSAPVLDHSWLWTNIHFT